MTSDDFTRLSVNLRMLNETLQAYKAVMEQQNAIMKKNQSTQDEMLVLLRKIANK